MGRDDSAAADDSPDAPTGDVRCPACSARFQVQDRGHFGVTTCPTCETRLLGWLTGTDPLVPVEMDERSGAMRPSESADGDQFQEVLESAPPRF
ncbi:MAG: hypothetical protein ABEI31_00515 [Halodesulfurarchaeum sp.]